MIIVPDTVSNTMMVRADEATWAGLRELLKKLDNEEYDTSRQIAVIALKNADAQSVARALNDGFRAPLEDRLRRDQAESEAGSPREARLSRSGDNSEAGPSRPRRR